MKKFLEPEIYLELIDEEISLLYSTGGPGDFEDDIEHGDHDDFWG